MENKHINLWQGEHGGWILEVLAFGEWYEIGVFGTRAAALARAKGL